MTVADGRRNGSQPIGARRLVGRQAELDALLAMSAELKAGAGRSIALVGEPGVGKSSLMAAAVAGAKAAGLPVLTAHGQGSNLPEAPGDAAGNTSALIAVDDLHRLTVDQVPDVERLLEEAAAGPVLCLLAYRRRQLSPKLASVLARATSAGLLEVWDLGPLSLDQARELLGELPNIEELHREAAGNPQYLTVIADESGTSVDAGLAILGELADLDPAALAVIEAAAVLGEPFHPDLLAEVADLELPEAMAALDTLTGLDLVRPAEPTPRLALRHDAVATVVYRRIAPSRRIALHRRAESALAELAAPIARRAHHVARAADPKRPEHATTLIAAARGALYASPATAAEHLRVALTLLRPDAEHWYEAQVLLARARLLTGDASASRALLDALRSTVPGGPPGEATALADSSRTERRLGRSTEAGALARSGLAALADQDSATAAALHCEMADYAYDSRDYETSRQHAETAAALARGHRDPVGEVNALAQTAIAQLFTGDHIAAQTTAAGAGQLVDAASDAALLTNLEALFQLGLAEGTLGQLADAERHLGRGAELCRRTGQTYILPQILTTLANTRVRSGSLNRALASLDEGAERLKRVVDHGSEAISSMLRAEVLFWRDDPGDAQQVVASAERAMALAEGRPISWAMSVRCYYAELVLHRGDPARCRALLLDAAGGTALPGLTVWRRPRACDTLAQAAYIEGDRAGVEHWATLAEACIRELPSVGRQGFALRARMRAHAARGEIEPAIRAAREAVADFTASGERIEVCRTLLAIAAWSLDTGRTDEVAAWLDQVADLAEQCGSGHLTNEATRLRDRLVSAGGAPVVPKPLASLSPREREIADLASSGMTSNEIAAALCLSTRTVESHLGRIYRKLSVSNRAGLTRTVLTGDAADPPRTGPGG